MKKLILSFLFLNTIFLASPIPKAFAFMPRTNWNTNCPYCGMYNNARYYPTYGTTFPSFYPSYYPWWAGYGSLSYPNFYAPSPWSGSGCTPNYFPGRGNAFAGKPNIYISAPKGTKVSVKLKLADDSNLLAALPKHGEKGWTATMGTNDTLTVDENGTQANYPYFFYDFRLNEKKLQDSAGVCFPKEELMPNLTKMLKDKGFKPQEIQDFFVHWSVKMPRSNSYCVFPQEEEILNEVAALEITPKPTSIKRLVFMIAVEEGLVKNDDIKFTTPPSQKYRSFASTENPAKAKSGIQVREWGVGFIASPK